jgi:hypothetical protein
MPVAEFIDWQILEEIDPWGQRREDWRFANLTSVLATVAGIRKADGSMLLARDFMPPCPLNVYEGPQPVEKKQQTVEEMEAIIRLWAYGTNQAFHERGIH